MENSSMARKGRNLKWLVQCAALAAGLLALPASAHATNNCPWINEATVSGLLGADATGTATGEGAGQPGVCTFVGELAHLCASGTAVLPAIGNEAVVCENDKKGALGERVVGRVRDQVFNITIASTQKHDPLLDRSALKTRIAIAAEQVSGNLF